MKFELKQSDYISYLSFSGEMVSEHHYELKSILSNVLYSSDYIILNLNNVTAIDLKSNKTYWHFNRVFEL